MTRPQRVNNDAIDEIRRQNLINEYITEYIINTDTVPTFQQEAAPHRMGA
jgi:hypothetical protein